jgi:arylsulfatase A-like enzyme
MNKRIIALGFLAAGFVIWGALFFSEFEESPKRQAILILLDTARWDRFMYAGYDRPTTPRMYELGEHGIVSNRHFAQATQTRPSLPSMLYSRYFIKAMFPYSSQIALMEPRDLMLKADDEAISLPRVLQAEGFKTGMISAHSWIRPGTPFAKQFQQLHFLPGEVYRYAPRTDMAIDRAKEWIEANRDDDYFLYIHLMENHFPHQFDDDAKVFFDGSDYPASSELGTDERFRKNGGRALTGDDRRYLDALYDGSLRHVDREIGRLVDFLRDQGLFNNTLIVITSDHGEHLLEVPNRFGHGGRWLDILARIPLIISYPGRVTPGRLESFSELVDVAPTIMGLLQVEGITGKRADGINLAEVSEGKIAGRSFAIAPGGLRTEEYKLIIDYPDEVLLGSVTPSFNEVNGSLYDLSEDPMELTDLWVERPEVVARLIEKYRRTLVHAFTRYRASVNYEQPQSAFAISANHFESDIMIAEVANTLDQKALSAVDSENGWVRSMHWEDNWLLATDRADPLQISFPLPNGRYQVGVKIAGAADLMLPGQDSTKVRGPKMSNFSEATGGYVEIGVSDISDESFRLGIVPESDSGVKIELIGFRPIEAGAVEPTPIDQDLLEQLRTLGYLD